MNWEFWVNVALVLITITSFIVTAIVYHRQNKIILANSQVSNFYSLLLYLKDSHYFLNYTKVVEIGPESSESIQYRVPAYIDANMIAELYLNSKIDKSLFETKLRPSVSLLSSFAFEFDDRKRTDKKSSNQKNFPGLYKYYLLKEKR